MELRRSAGFVVPPSGGIRQTFRLKAGLQTRHGDDSGLAQFSSEPDASVPSPRLDPDIPPHSDITMVRLLVQFTEAQVKSLRAESRRQKKPVAALVRESVEAHLTQPTTAKPALDKWQRAKLAVGGSRSGVKDLALNHDKYLGELKSW